MNDKPWSIPKAVIIAGMKSFLEKVVTEGQSLPGVEKLYNYWLEQTKEFATEGFGVCDEQEIDGIIQAMTAYSKPQEKRIRRRYYRREVRLGRDYPVQYADE